MGWEAWFTGATIASMLVLLATGRFGTDIVMMGAVLVLLISGIIGPADAIRGFSNPGVVTVALLYVVATGLQETGAMNLLTTRFIGRPSTTLAAQARIVLPVATLSAFVNNTPLVAMFFPVLRELSRRTRIPASRLFMPLSFAAILGGCCTLIGTSTNLVTHGLISEHNRAHPDQPIPQLGLWTLSWVGIPVAILGCAYILAAGRRLLPDRGAGRDAPEHIREYMTAMRVGPASAIVGRSIEAAGLRHLPGLFLSRIDRADESIIAVSPDEVLRAGDVLIFVGRLESVVDLQRMKGLTPVTDETGSSGYRPDLRLIEAVISHSSPIVGQSVRDAGIRTRYEAVVVAVHRLGHRLAGRIGDIVLRPGDTLLLEAAPGFAERHRDSADFHLVSALEGAATLRHERAWLAIAVLAGTILGLSFEELVPPLTVAMAGAGAMVLLRCCTGPQARAGIEWPVIITIGASFAVGSAMQRSGLAGTIASSVVAWCQGEPRALLAATYLLTLLFTTLISNNAAVALMFPVTLGVASQAGLNVMPFAASITLAASLEFTTPLGYQTNLMVMGPGNYTWGDFARFGGPLTLLSAGAAILLIPLAFPLVPPG